ncbi:MAG TPA: acyl-CoA dehydrogenase family protein, partial [Ignavibacteriales bacterium]|nr:acyl-CoA dehydrogenase family protein [Ignavibacteriales bacterium]
MIFELTEDQKLIQQSAKEFAEQEIAPTALERDKTGEFPYAIIKQLGEMGFMGMMVPPEYGGAGLDAVSYALA